MKGAFKNLTNLKVPEEVQAILSYGPTFIIPHTTTTIEDLLNTIKKVEGKVGNEDPTNYHTNWKTWNNHILNIITNNNTTLNNTEKATISAVNRTEDFLRTHKNTTIMEADKGKVTVLLYKNQKNKLIGEMMRKSIEKNLYGRIDYKTPIDEQNAQSRIKMVNQRRLNEKITMITTYGIFKTRSPHNIGKEKKWINELKKSQNNLAKMYPTIKIHKPQLQIRPIISKKDTINHTLGQILNQILNQIKLEWNHKNNFHHNIKNIEELPQKLHQIENVKGNNFITADITDMYNTIDKNRLITIMEEFIEENGKYQTNTIINLIKFDVFQNNNFIYDGKLYHQKLGLPMGAPTSGIYAEFFTDFYLNIKYHRLEMAGITNLYKYVDDLLLIGKNINTGNIQNILEKGMNLKFTFDRGDEINNSIDFLDTNIKINNDTNKYITSWNKKYYTSSRLLNNRSHHPHTTKIGVLTSRILHILKITSNEEIHNSLTELVNDIKMNGYKNSTIKTIIQNTINNENHDISIDKKHTTNTFINTQMKKINTSTKINLKTKTKTNKTQNRKYYIKTPYINDKFNRTLQKKINLITNNTILIATKNKQQQLRNRLQAMNKIRKHRTERRKKPQKNNLEQAPPEEKTQN